jgi:hypothetical protein
LEEEAMQTKLHVIKEDVSGQTINTESAEAIKEGTSTGMVAEQQVRVHAYHIWRESGEPDGHDADHWLQAEQELTRNVPARQITGVSSKDALRSGATGVSSKDALRSGATGVSSKDALRSGAKFK